MSTCNNTTLTFIDGYEFVKNMDNKNNIENGTIFNFNIRGAMPTTKKSVFGKIIQTVIDGKDNMEEKNNGLTIVVSSIKIIDDKKILLKSASVINGRQTIMGVLKGVVTTEDNMYMKDKLSLPTKIIQIDYTNYEEAIEKCTQCSVSSNSQNNTKNSDYYSNEAQHKYLYQTAKLLCKPLRFIYNYKREAKKNYKEQYTDKLEMVRLIYTFKFNDADDRVEQIIANHFEEIFGTPAYEVAIIKKIRLQVAEWIEDYHKSDKYGTMEKLYKRYPKKRIIDFTLYLLVEFLKINNNIISIKERTNLIKEIYIKYVNDETFKIENVFSKDFKAIFMFTVIRFLEEVYENTDGNDILRNNLTTNLEEKFKWVHKDVVRGIRYFGEINTELIL